MQICNHFISFWKNSYIIALLATIFLFHSCQVQVNDDGLRSEIYCSVDSTKLDENNKFWYEQGSLWAKQKLDLGGFLSSDDAHSGNHSVLLTKKKAFGLSTEFFGILGDERFHISIWRKGSSENSALVVQGDKAYSLYFAKKKAVEVTDDGWEKLEMYVDIPPNIRSFKVYAWNISDDSVYFDDLRIQQLPPQEFSVFNGEPRLHLYFTDSKMKRFQEKRIKAFNTGIHVSDGEWMKGIMSDEKNVMPVKTRFKGDWLDHLQGQKWSFRIKMRDDYTFNRMRVFSVQSPSTRYFLHEYISHQLFNQEDVLTTRYGFTPLFLNGKSIGLYAWEEHFAKQLIEYNLRREGPIVKFDEDPFWGVQQINVLDKKWVELPYYETSRILAFGMGKTLAKPNLKSQFSIAESLMNQYKNHEAPVEELFNIDALAKYWALNDIVNGRHGLAWHNQRMYYNPVLCKLEPINFDNFTEEFAKGEHRALLSASLLKDKRKDGANQLLKSIFTSPVLLERYFYYLEKYTQKSFIDDFLNSQQKDIAHYQEMINQEFDDYTFDPEFLYQNIAEIKEQMIGFKNSPDIDALVQQDLDNKMMIADSSYLPVSYDLFVNSFYYPTDLNTAGLLIENYTGGKLELLGLADENNRLLFLLEDEIFLKPYNQQLDDTLLSVKYLSNASQLAFRVEGHREVYYSELSLWKKNTTISPYQELLRSFNIETCELFEHRGDSLIISGVHELTSKVLVPKGKVVVFEAGSQVNILNEGTIISHSPLYMLGTQEQPIKIYSTDTTANAFTVLQAGGRSKLSHVVFEDLNTLEYDGWNLTGAVNFYESDVDIDHCSFLKNHCEDALNIIRADFHVTESKFEDIYADAFDSDFCTGLLDYTSFDRVGNDAIDFSTSQIHIEHCEITNILDKGISGGEGSTLWVKNTNIINCNIGAASKDLSNVSLENVNIENCYYGLVALRKKPEYGAAVFDTKKLKLVNCQVNHLIEKNSVLNFNGRKIDGTREKVAEMFY